MATIIQTGNDLARQLNDVPPEAHLWIYCGFDACTPQEILPEIKKRFDERTYAVYDFERMMHAVALSMSLTGVLVDEAQITATVAELEDKQKALDEYINSMFIAFWGQTVNIRSPDQMKEFFYHSEDGLQLRVRTARRKNSFSPTIDRQALESIFNENYQTRPLIKAIFMAKEAQKRLEFLRRGVDRDKRVRCTFSPSSTETGRWASYKSPWGRGGNYQNQDEDTRKIYVPDEGYVFVVPDLRQAESYGVAYYSCDPNYLSAVKSGDIHTAVAKMMWPELPWPNTRSGDKHLAETSPFYRHFSRRDTTKRAGHATNYLGSAKEVSNRINIPISVMEEFQTIYRSTFPGVFDWHKEIQTRLQTDGVLVTPLGRVRTFFGRLYDDTTLKEAIAFLPQSVISDIFKIGLYRVWHKHCRSWGMDPKRPVLLYADLHDGGLLGVKTEFLDELAPDLIKLFSVSVRMPGGVMQIPIELKVGWSWQKKSLLDWKPGVLESLGPRPDPTEALLNIDVQSIR